MFHIKTLAFFVDHTKKCIFVIVTRACAHIRDALALHKRQPYADRLTTLKLPTQCNKGFGRPWRHCLGVLLS